MDPTALSCAIIAAPEDPPCCGGKITTVAVYRIGSNHAVIADKRMIAVTVLSTNLRHRTATLNQLNMEFERVNVESTDAT
jgi:hypothetical protein